MAMKCFNKYLFQAKQGLPLKLSWQRGEGMPLAVSGNIHSVVLQEKVYVSSGGGQYTVMVYDSKWEQWSTLPKHRTKSFGMAVITGKLVLIGGLYGVSYMYNVTEEIATWDPQAKNWTNNISPMRTGRHSPAATSYNKWLVVAGGCDENGSLVDVVEILDTTTQEWYSAAPLPVMCTQMRSAVVQDEWYLMGCHDEAESKRVFSVSLPALILFSKAPSQGSSTLWRPLPNPPMSFSAPLAFRESLLAVGGKTDSGKLSSAIHLYQPWSKNWVKAGELPSELACCTCTELPSGKLLVAGGEVLRIESRRNKQYPVMTMIRTVNIATVGS